MATVGALFVARIPVFAGDGIEALLDDLLSPG
jgi:hypothetical protein